MSEQIYKLPKGFKIDDIEEVHSSVERNNRTVIKGGRIEDWKSSEIIEKAKARPLIASTVVSIWGVCVIVGLIRLVTVGDIYLFTSSSLLLYHPICTVVNYYFKGG